MEVNADKKSSRISLDVSFLFLHVVSVLVRAIFLTYDEIFQAVSGYEGVLLPKPFLDPTPPTAQLRLGLLGLPYVWQTEEASPRPALSL
jgi:hypothetical protein